MEKVRYFFLIFLFAASNSFAERMSVEEYVDYYRDVAISEMYRTGIPASIKLGQGILESDAGNSKLAKQSNNHFGIKCKKEWTGDTYYHEDDDYNSAGRLIESCFRAYYSSYESYIDHSEFLTGRDRYEILFSYHHTDYKQWAFGLKTAGYATAKGYAEKLISIIERYGLAKFDFYPNPYEARPMNLANAFREGDAVRVLGEATQLEELETKPIEDIELTPEGGSKSGIPLFEKPVVLFPDYNKPYFEINRIVAVSATGRTLDEISAETEVKVSKLLKYNELESSEDLLENQYVFLTKKQKTFEGVVQEHRVQKGETMYVIAQRYGVRLKNLYKLNLMQKGQQPAVGELIQLTNKASNSPQLSE